MSGIIAYSESAINRDYCAAAATHSFGDIRELLYLLIRADLRWCEFLTPAKHVLVLTRLASMPRAFIENRRLYRQEYGWRLA